VRTAVNAYPLMAKPDEPREEALKRLDERLDAFAERQKRKPLLRYDAEGSGAGYRLIGELIGGVLGGLGFGWLLDQLAGTGPWGLIGGVLIGSGASVFVIARSAGRMSGKAADAGTGAASAPSASDDEDDEDGPGFTGR
jgi:ATP synthase protein I